MDLESNAGSPGNQLDQPTLDSGDEVREPSSDTKQSQIADPTDWLVGGGEMGRLIRSSDWAATSLGPIEAWPQSLRSAVSILLPSKAQIAMFWGPDLVTLYNDAYRPVLGRKHPQALGRPVSEVWSELWGAGLSDLFQGVLETGEAFWATDHPFFLERFGFPEETFFDISYDPIRDETGHVAGLFCIVSETTARVLSDRRLRILSAMSFLGAAAQPSKVAACREAADVINQDRRDLPFALIYLLDAENGRSTLSGTAGIAPGARGAPSLIDMSAPESARETWPLQEVLSSDKFTEINDLTARFGEMPSGIWPEPVSTAMALPIRASAHDHLLGFLVAGISPRRPMDEQYRSFLELIASQVGSLIGSAEAYEQEKRRAEALAEIDRAKTAFFSNVSHEFRTPLTLIEGPLEELLTDETDTTSATVRERVAIAHRNSLRLHKLVNTLLDFSRIEAGRSTAYYQPTDIAAFTEELASSFRSACEKAGLDFVVDCRPVDDEVVVDRTMWEKIVLNILSNAFKYTFSGRIEVRLAPAPGVVTLCIKDTGVGISAAEIPNLFKRFYRVQGSKGRTHEGSGIGLALVRELTKLHGGEINVESELDRGTTFTVTIPTGRAHLPQDQIQDSTPLSSVDRSTTPYVEEALRWIVEDGEGGDERSVSESGSENGLAPNTQNAVRSSTPKEFSVLIVDDNADMRQYLSRLLSERYRVRSAHDGIRALAATAEEPPDLVITDVMMPDLDGFGLLRELRNDPRTREIPVILLSARAGEESCVEGLAAGADDYLIKPFSAAEFCARVHAHLQLADLRREARDTLRKSEQEMVDFFENAAVPLHWVGPDGTILRANQAELTLLGYERDEYVGQNIMSFHVDQPVIEDILEKLTRGETIAGYPARLKRKDGTIRKVLISSSVLFDKGDFIHTRCITIDVTEHEQNETRLRTQDAVTRILADADSLDEAAPLILQSICEHLNWEVGGLWRITPDGRFLRCVDTFHLPSIHIPRFEGLSREIVFEAGVGLPGRVLASQKAAWIGDIVRDSNFPRAAVAADEGLHGAFAFPIKLRDQVLGVIEFFTREIREPDLSLLDMMTAIGSQIGQFIERRRAEHEKSQLLELEREARDEAETLNELARTLAAQLDLETLVQHITDRATKLTGAQFGAFFYNVFNENGEALQLYTLSGAPRSAFDKFDLPRNTPIFEPTFRGTGVVRLDDVTKDPRYGTLSPHYGMPKGHLKVRSYLAAPVISRTGEVLGGLFFGHSDIGVFRPSEERMIVGLAAHAAVAMDNARLYSGAQKEIALRKEAEADLREARDSLEDKVLERSNQIRQVLNRLVDIQEEERRRIARNIHDHIGQQITGLRINLATLERSCDKNEGLADLARKVQGLAEELDASIDFIAWDLIPPDLENLGFLKAMNALVGSWSRRFDISAEFTHLRTTDLQLSEQQQVHLYRITQEALHNIVKHASAHHVDVLLTVDDGTLSLIVEDDGVGFDAEGLLPNGAASVGLTSMHERATLLDGVFAIDSSVGEGTTVFVRVPVSKTSTPD